MPNIIFYIDRTNKGKDGKAPIKVNVTINYKNVAKTVGRVKEVFWNENPRNKNNIMQYVSASRNPNPEHDHEHINLKLHEFKTQLVDYFKECDRENIGITYELVRNYFKGKKATVDTKKDFFEAWDEYLAWGEISLGKKKNSTRGIKTTGKLIKQFNDDTRYNITFENITLDLYENLKIYILDVKGYSFNYFANTIRRLKAFLNSEMLLKYYKGIEHKKFKVEEEVGTLVYLTNTELSTLYHFNFKNPKHGRARDIFVFAALTGLRISDWKALTRANIVNDTLVRRVQKTGKYIELPLLPEAMAIIKKYEHQHKVLPKISEAKFNEYIKVACKKAGIKTPVEVEPIRKGKKKKVSPKYKLIGSHVARKTFVTGMVKRGFEIELIKEFAAIKDNRTLSRYLHLDNDLKREKLKIFGKL